MKKRKLRPKYYYHITAQDDWDDEVELTPRDRGDNRGLHEPKTSRICVAPSISQCCVAVYIEGDIWSIFRTVDKVYAHPAVKIGDSCVTGERWLKKKTKFIKIGTFDADDLQNELGDLSRYEIGRKDEDILAKQRVIIKRLRKALPVNVKRVKEHKSRCIKY